MWTISVFDVNCHAGISHYLLVFGRGISTWWNMNKLIISVYVCFSSYIKILCDKHSTPGNETWHCDILVICRNRLIVVLHDLCHIHVNLPLKCGKGDNSIISINALEADERISRSLGGYTKGKWLQEQRENMPFHHIYMYIFCDVGSMGYQILTYHD